MTFGLGLGLGFDVTPRKGGSSGPPPATVALDPPITTAMASKGLLAFGFDRMVQGFSGNSVNLKRLSDNATQDFGFSSSTGAFDMAAVNTWRSGANVDVVKFYDQFGGAKTLDAGGTTAFVRSDVVSRFGTTYDGTTGLLARSTTDGGVGVDLAAAGHFVVANTGANLVTGNLEVHTLWSNNARKKATNDSTDIIAGGTTTGEWIITYGLNLNTRFFFEMAGAAAAGTSRLQTSATDSTNANYSFISGGGTARWKQYAQHAHSYVVTPTNLQSFGAGRRFQNTAASANNITALAAGALNDGTLVIGASFANTTTNTVATTLRLNGIFGGVIMTTGLTDAERHAVQSKLTAIAQQHRIKSVADVMAYMDEWVFMKDVDVNGLVTGRNGLLALQFTKGGSATWDFAYALPYTGIQGIRSPTSNTANSFLATTSYFATVQTGSMISVHFNEQTNNSLQYTFIQGTDPVGTNGQDPDWSLGMGYDHNSNAAVTMMAGTRDTSGLMGGRTKADETAWGAAVYEATGGGINQTMGKYNRSTSHNNFTFDEVITDGTLTQAWWAGTVGGASPTYLLDAPVVPPVPENTQSSFRNDGLHIHIATFTAPVGYDRTASYATRKTQRLGATTRSYLAAGNTPLGHFDGSIARNVNAGVVDSAATAKIKSHQFQQGFNGTRVLMAFKAGTAITQTQAEELHVNMYKILAA